MNDQVVIGALGSKQRSVINRSWVHELVSDPFSIDELIAVEMEVTGKRDYEMKLPYAAIVCQFDPATFKQQAAILRSAHGRDIPIAIHFDEMIKETSGYAEILKLASVVSTESDVLAKELSRLCTRVVVIADRESNQDNASAPVVVQDHAGVKRWLWIIDPAKSPRDFARRTSSFGSIRDIDHSVKVTVIGESCEMDLPAWMDTLSIPTSISTLGGDAFSAWLMSFSDGWDRACWDDEEPAFLSRIYRELGVVRYGYDSSGDLVRKSWPASQFMSSGHWIHQVQRQVLAGIVPGLRGQNSGTDLFLKVYDKSNALNTQRIAFPTSYQHSSPTSAVEQPLVSILIPAYNRPEYLASALESALFQTYENIEIIIGDDSTTDDVEKLIRAEYLPKFPNITYWRNAQNRGQYQNDLDLISASNGEYLNILMDDDLLHLDKIRSQMNFFLGKDGDQVGLVTSHRAVIDANGMYRNLFAATKDLFNETERLSGDEAIRKSLISNRNFFGEPTTVLFRKSMLQEDFGSLFGRKYVCNVDHSSWLQILQHGDVIFMNEALSAYRLHDGQQSWTARAALGGAVDFAHATLELHARGYLASADDFSAAVGKCLARAAAEQVKIVDPDSLDTESLELYETLSAYMVQCRKLLDHA